jgi:hypothetical protein
MARRTYLPTARPRPLLAQTMSAYLIKEIQSTQESCAGSNVASPSSPEWTERTDGG